MLIKKLLPAMVMASLASGAIAGEGVSAVEVSPMDLTNALVEGYSDTMAMRNVLVTNPETDKARYMDVRLDLATDAEGNIRITSAKMTPIPTAKPPQVSSGTTLQAGKYQDQNGCEWLIDGPSRTTSNRISYSIVRNNVGLESCGSKDTHSILVTTGGLENNELVMPFKTPYKNMLEHKSDSLMYGAGNRGNSQYPFSATRSGQTVNVIRYSISGSSGGSIAEAFALTPRG
ncbi:hypothetical protein [Photobacterium sp. DNB22_13_2]